MALQRQGSGKLVVGIVPAMNGDHKLVGAQRPASVLSRMHDHGNVDQGSSRAGTSSRHSDLGALMGRSPFRFVKGRRLAHSGRGTLCSSTTILVLCLFAVVVMIFSSEAISNALKGSSSLDDVIENSDPLKSSRTLYMRGDIGDDSLGKDTRDGSGDGGSRDVVELEQGQNVIDESNKDVSRSKGSATQDLQKKKQGGTLYNEINHNELREYEAQLENQQSRDAEWDNSADGSATGTQISGLNVTIIDKLQPDEDEYDDDGGDGDDGGVERKGGSNNVADDKVQSNEELQTTEGLVGGSGSEHDELENVHASLLFPKPEQKRISRLNLDNNLSSLQIQKERDVDVKVNKVPETLHPVVQKSSRGKKKSKHSPTTPCEINFLSTAEGLQEPEDRSNFANFSLSYVWKEERPQGTKNWEPRFGGHQTLAEREDSFQSRDQTIHCGFVQAPEGEPWTGFELSDSDVEFLGTCHIAVSSCIFGNWDHLRNPTNKKMSSSSKKKVCFVMFVDQNSLDVILEEGPKPNSKGTLGLWRIVLIKNLPFKDGRRNGKVPKFLTHRLFPNARYSIWLDSKLRLQSDPLLILEYFLWRGKQEYAISNHYDRHCVWEEVAQNKRLNKFNHSVIDEQFHFYQRDGLMRFNGSDPHRLLPSHVPEGSFIVRAHTPMANLFSCLWFNEVDRFTPRDQLSFAYTFLKFARTNPTEVFRLNMFKDCERKAMAKLYRHRQDGTTAKARVL